ncbi:hypothetical protein SAMD00019534_080290 [Acytostelium subglobosum LB1]|uniref:hypothetical protein n=1 Tax=Acytostelium subglobosum LB1 TaxID=1410327 RepID=UPI0006450878|nr:hypothetical protein SAMD00019534_080290 [Acytostelium subglobosum LB1]GAM24854.1 hypothetical protein SAMD00019534_080290 [Acytostelium subglobosum LB1]|eukprot:XP_012751943.1 hypothetical protein SAMD00019534_080290 [Acytostelium subglobosum LB1]
MTCCYSNMFKTSRHQRYFGSNNINNNNTSTSDTDEQPLPELSEEKKRLIAEIEALEAEFNKEYINPKTGERGGPTGPEPTRYGDWERKGRLSDF